MLRPHPGGELRAIEAAVHPQFEQFGIVGQGTGSKVRAPLRSGQSADSRVTPSSRPSVSTSRKRLRPLVFLAAS
jgi:hypothetical protein